nr:hypothetical protein [Tanacetum cinerariifolium]
MVYTLQFTQPHPGQGVLGPAPAHYASQATSLLSTFSTMTLQDPTWHMDTSASSHLNFNAINLSTIFYKRLVSSVHVRDDNSISATNTDHSIIPSIHRPLHLYNVLDFLFRHIHFRSDSSGGLYPVTKPSTTPTAFLSTSTSTWHQRPGHPNAHGFVNSRYPHHVFLLQRSLYGLKQAPRAWFQRFAESLHNEFDMTDLGALNYFPGIPATRTPTGLFLSQKKYALQLFERAHMVNCNPSWTPVDTESKLGLSYVVQQICLYIHDPMESHFAALKRCPSTPRSTSGYCDFLGDNILSWSAKRQHTLSRSSAEAEYHDVAKVVAEIAWLRNLLRELHSPLSTATLVYCDNVSGPVRVLHVPSHYQCADIFTKGLPSALFEDFRTSLSVRPPPAQTARAY